MIEIKTIFKLFKIIYEASSNAINSIIHDLMNNWKHDN